MPHIFEVRFTDSGIIYQLRKVAYPNKYLSCMYCDSKYYERYGKINELVCVAIKVMNPPLLLIFQS